MREPSPAGLAASEHTPTQVGLLWYLVAYSKAISAGVRISLPSISRAGVQLVEL